MFSLENQLSIVCINVARSSLLSRYALVSTGGTAAAIEKAGVPVKKVEEVTSFPEMVRNQLLDPTLLSFSERQFFATRNDAFGYDGP